MSCQQLAWEVSVCQEFRLCISKRHLIEAKQYKLLGSVNYGASKHILTDLWLDEWLTSVASRPSLIFGKVFTLDFPFRPREREVFSLAIWVLMLEFNWIFLITTPLSILISLVHAHNSFWPYFFTNIAKSRFGLLFLPKLFFPSVYQQDQKTAAGVLEIC